MKRDQGEFNDLKKQLQWFIHLFIQQIFIMYLLGIGILPGSGVTLLKW